nr:PREDICTED: uncharacterized protein LOC105679555 [Linepithema humile]
MSNQLISVPVFIEDTGETVTLKLSPQDAAKATKDLNYMTSLIKNIYRKRNENVISQESQISIDENDETDSVRTASSASYVSSPEPQEFDNNPKDQKNDKSLFIWSSKCVYLLLDKYEEWKEEFSAGTKRHNKIWEAIADNMRKTNIEYTMTGPQCQSKLNGLKKTYKKILDYNSVSGNDRKTWPYFQRMHEIFGKSGWANPKAIATEAGPSTSNEEAILLESSSKNCKNNEGKSNKRKIETIINNFILDMKEERAEREKKGKPKKHCFRT